MLILYVNQIWEVLDLPLKHPALAIFYVLAAHRVDSFIKEHTNAGIKVKLIPGGVLGNFNHMIYQAMLSLKSVSKLNLTIGTLIKFQPS